MRGAMGVTKEPSGERFGRIGSSLAPLVGARRDPATFTLAERHLIRTPLCFLDETGLVHNPVDRFFGVGMVKSNSAPDLTRMMRNWRDRHRYYEEVKFSSLKKSLLPLYLELLDLFCSLPSARFTCFILEKKPGWETRFGSIDKVYELLARKMLMGSCGMGEIITVIADEYSTGPRVRFEEEVAEWVNAEFGRLAITQVVRVNSKGVDGIQMTDLLLGAVAYDCKDNAGLISTTRDYKRQFVRALRGKLGVVSLSQPHKDGRFSLFFHGQKPPGK
jgi:hypothetical protein